MSDVRHPHKMHARRIRIIEPDYRPCRWGCGVLLLGRDECPPWLRSNREIALAQQEAKQSA